TERAQQRDLRVECVARPRRERGRDRQVAAARRLHDEGRRARIPRRITTRLERRAQTTTRKRRRIRLALHQVLAAELEDRATTNVRRDERVVLLRRRARQ